MEEKSTYENLIESLAYNNDLEIVSTTSGTNGYPSNVKLALIGFKDIDQAKEIADAWELAIICLHKRDGWNLWERGNEMYDSFETDESMLESDNYTLYEKGSEEEFFSEMMEQLESFGFRNIEKFNEFAANVKESYSEIESLDEDELAVITYDGKFIEKRNRKVMGYSLDTHHYVIGVGTY